MQTGLTKRDKKLLVFLINLVIVFLLGYLIIYPSVRMALKYGEKVIIQESQREINDRKVMNLPMLSMDLESYEAEVEEKSVDFYDIMTPSEIDRMMTGMALDYGLNAYDLVIDREEVPAETTPYQYSLRAAGADGGDYDDAYAADTTGEDLFSMNESEAEEAEPVVDEGTASDKYEKKFREDFADRYGYAYGTDPSLVASMNDPFAMFDEIDRERGLVEEDDLKGTHAIYRANVSMRLGGTRDDINRFLQALFNENKELIVTSYQWTDVQFVERAPESEDGPELMGGTRKELALSFSMFLCDK